MRLANRMSQARTAVCAVSSSCSLGGTRSRPHRGSLPPRQRHPGKRSANPSLFQRTRGLGFCRLFTRAACAPLGPRSSPDLDRCKARVTLERSGKVALIKEPQSQGDIGHGVISVSELYPGALKAQPADVLSDRAVIQLPE